MTAPLERMSLAEGIRALVEHARQEHPDCPEWVLTMRPESYLLLLDVTPGLLWPSDPLSKPLDITTFADCEIETADLIRDIVTISAGANAPHTITSSYWLDLADESIHRWTGDDIDRWREDYFRDKPAGRQLLKPHDGWPSADPDPLCRHRVAGGISPAWCLGVATLSLLSLALRFIGRRIHPAMGRGGRDGGREEVDRGACQPTWSA